MIWWNVEVPDRVPLTSRITGLRLSHGRWTKLLLMRDGRKQSQDHRMVNRCDQAIPTGHQRP